MCDSKGVISKERKNIDFKSAFAIDTKLRTLGEAIKDADVFWAYLQNVVSKEMVKSMAKNPIIFACANQIQR